MNMIIPVILKELMQVLGTNRLLYGYREWKCLCV